MPEITPHFMAEHFPHDTPGFSPSPDAFPLEPNSVYWDPREDYHYGQSLLSANEYAVLLEIEKTQDPKVSPAIVWLAQRLRRMMNLEGDQFQFPPYASLINPIACNAYAMRFVERAQLGSSRAVHRAIADYEIYDHTISCTVHEAYFVVRPYLRAPGDISEKDRFVLEESSLFLTLNGERIYSGSCGHILAFPGRKNMARFVSSGGIFGAGFLDSQQQAYPDPGGAIMAPNGDRFQAMLSLSGDLSAPLDLHFGLVAAKYSTRAL